MVPSRRSHSAVSSASSGALRELTTTTEKRDALEITAAFAQRLSIPPRLADQLVFTADELISNALFNAPVDRLGHHRHAHRPRTEAVVLEPGEEIELALRCDGRRIGILVLDPFGTLTPKTLTGCLGQELGQLRLGSSSGGVGLFSLLSMVSHLVVSFSPGQRTENIGLIDIRGKTHRDFLHRGFSFNLFVGGERVAHEPQQTDQTSSASGYSPSK